jgi:hypothetical protein
MFTLPPAIANRFRAGELIPAIAQDTDSKEVLMLFDDIGECFYLPHPDASQICCSHQDGTP